MLISPIPDFVLIIVALGIILIIYKYLPEETKKASVNFIKAWGIYIVLFLGWLYFKNKWGRVYEQPERWPANIYYATFIVGFILLLYFGFKNWLYEHRYNSIQLIADDLHGSVAKYFEVTYYRVTWAIFFLGTSGSSTDEFVFPWPFPKKILVAPKSACQFIGNQILVLSQVEKVDNFDIIPDVKTLIDSKYSAKWCNDFYFGLWSKEIIAKDPNYTDVKDDILKLSARLNELNTYLKGKLGITKTFISDSMGMVKKYQGKDWRPASANKPPEES